MMPMEMGFVLQGIVMIGKEKLAMIIHVVNTVFWMLMILAGSRVQIGNITLRKMVFAF
jgi:hypothetical protein